MPVAGFVLRTSSRLAVDAGRLSVRAIPRTLMPAFRQSAMLMRSSWLRYLELIFWGMSTVERYQSTDGFSFLPFDRVLPLRHTLPVRLDTPTARAACVKFMPASRCSTYRRRRAAHISPRVAYSTPSNTHLSTWPSHQSARRCDDHWNPPCIAVSLLSSLLNAAILVVMLNPALRPMFLTATVITTPLRVMAFAVVMGLIGYIAALSTKRDVPSLAVILLLLVVSLSGVLKVVHADMVLPTIGGKSFAFGRDDEAGEFPVAASAIVMTCWLVAVFTAAVMVRSRLFLKSKV